MAEEGQLGGGLGLGRAAGCDVCEEIGHYGGCAGGEVLRVSGETGEEVGREYHGAAVAVGWGGREGHLLEAIR